MDSAATAAEDDEAAGAAIADADSAALTVPAAAAAAAAVPVTPLSILIFSLSFVSSSTEHSPYSLSSLKIVWMSPCNRPLVSARKRNSLSTSKLSMIVASLRITGW